MVSYVIGGGSDCKQFTREDMYVYVCVVVCVRELEKINLRERRGKEYIKKEEKEKVEKTARCCVSE